MKFRKIKNQKKFLRDMAKKVQDNVDVKKNNEFLFNLFKPLLLKLASKYNKYYHIPFNEIYNETVVKFFEIIREYDDSKNDNFEAYLKTLLDKRLLFYSQKWASKQYPLSFDLEQSLKKKYTTLSIDDERKDIDILIELMKEKPAKTRRIIYYYFYKKKTLSQIAKDLKITIPEVGGTVKELKNEIIHILSKSKDNKDS